MGFAQAGWNRIVMLRNSNSKLTKKVLPVHSIGVEFVEMIDSFLQFGGFLRLVDGQAEKIHVGIQRELVHGIDSTQIVQDEE